MKTAASPAYSNRLVNEKSPYLLQHAHNPVDWFPWGEEAFAKAKQEDKPIFLSIGYSTCHWCHVMAHESFEDPAAAQIMNEHFVNIKVDREERPDVDRVYMTFVQATTGSGGWPMSVWLTPDLKPFAGGTYFPPSDRYGRPGFATVLKRLSDAWKNERARVMEQGDQIVAALQQYTNADAKAAGSVVDDTSLVEGFEQIAHSFDPELGGFGSAPKFPRPVTLNFLFRVYAAEGAASERGQRALEMNLVTLRKMAQGGMHDHLGGGFHRYSVDKFWHIPHFEKMLYDQAQLALAYLDAFQITRDPQWEKTARDLLDYVRRDMTDKAGGFYSAEDADSIIEHGKPDHAEGAFYVWTQDEIIRVLGEKAAALFKYFYGVEREGNAPEGSDPHEEFKGKNTLIQRHTIAEAAEHWKREAQEIEQELVASRRQLFELRAQRPRPHLDDKIITAWNGLMISAFARAYQVLDDRAYLEAANRAADFIAQNLWDRQKGVLIRSYRQGASNVAGFADDYAFLVQGLLDLYEAGGDIGRLQWALELQEKQDQQFLDRDRGGYFSGTGQDPNILLRMKEDYDGAEPSPNSVTASNLLRLAQMTGAEGLRSSAEKVIQAFAPQLKKMPSAMPQMLVALAFQLEKPTQIVIAGAHGAPDTQALLRQVHQHFLPNKILLHADGAEGQKFLAAKEPFLETVAPLEGKAAAYVCENFTCKLPTNDPAKLGELLK